MGPFAHPRFKFVSQLSSQSQTESDSKQGYNMEWIRYSTPCPVDPRMSIAPRNKEEVEEMSHRLKSLHLFHSLPWVVLNDIASSVQLIVLPPRTLLFKQGESGIFWYIVLSGSLDVSVADSGDEAKVSSVCTLSAGATMGESVLFGEKRTASVETLEPSQLLVLPSHKLKELCSKHPQHMARPIPLLEKEERPLSVSDSGVEDIDSSVGSSRRASGRFGSVFQNVKDTQLVLMGFLLYQLIKDNYPTLLSNRTFHLRTYPDSCSGKELVDWVLLSSSVQRSRNMVVGMWQALLDAGVIAHTVSQEQQFVDSTVLYYHFTVSADPSPGDTTAPRSTTPTVRCSLPTTLGRGGGRVRSANSMASILSSTGSTGSSDSVSTQLDECFDALEQCAPESLTFAAFMKKPEERAEEDIRIIFEELLHVKAFAQLSHAVKKELATCVAIDSYQGKSGHVLFKQGDVGASWYIILKGSVSVIVKGKGAVCTLHEGDDFGKLALVNDAPRAASIQLREDHCSFLRVDKDDFNRTLRSVEANTVRLQEYGRDVLVLEKEDTEKYSVVSGTPEKMVEHLMDVASKDDDSDPFFYEFFLTHPVFISMEDICSILKATYQGRWHHRVEHETQIVIMTEDGVEHEDTDAEKGDEVVTEETKRKVVKLVVKWVKVMGQSLVSEPTFNQLFQDLTSLLVKDGQADALDTLNQTFMQSYLSRRGTTMLKPGKTNTLFRKATSPNPAIGSTLPAVPAAVCTDKVPVVANTSDGRSCSFYVPLQTTASEILSTACDELNVSPSTSDLCEVTTMGEPSVVKPSTVSVTSSLALNSLLYVLPKGSTDKLDVSAVQQSFASLQEEGSMVDRETARDMALHLTLLDWQLLSNISRSEYVYHVFGRHKFGKITTNLDLFLRRFNEVQFWVVTEVCRLENLQTRVKVVCKFVKMANHCKKLNNLSSFFAIVFGLMNVAVSRLHSTWERVPTNLKRKLEGFEALADPSRNHRALRMYQNNLKTPVIPFLPLVMKDAAFIHEGNDTFVQDGLVNFEKMRMLASRVLGVEQLMAGKLSESVTAAALKTPHIREYIVHLKAVNNARLLSQQSKKIE